MLRTMAEPLGEVCSVTGRQLRRGLGLQTSRHVSVFFPAKGRILFEQASYIYLLETLRTQGRPVSGFCIEQVGLGVCIMNRTLGTYCIIAVSGKPLYI